MNESDLIQKFKQAYPGLSLKAIHKIASLGKIRTVAKKEIFIKQGKIDRRLAFVIEGLLRGFTNKDGEETTLWFSHEYDVVASYKGILQKEAALISYQALEDSYLFEIPYDDLKSLSLKDPSISSTIITMLEQLLVESIQRTERFTLQNAEQRYLNLLEHKPEILNRVSQKLLASYIGITPVSLSRLRSRLNKSRP